MEIYGLHLFSHYESPDIRVVGDGHMKRVSTIGVCYGAHDCKTCSLVKEGVTYNKRGAAAFLFMTRLGIKGNGNEISLFGNILLHLPDLSADWFTPINLFRLVVSGYA